MQKRLLIIAYHWVLCPLILWPGPALAEGPLALDRANGLTMVQQIKSAGTIQVSVTKQSVKLSNSKDDMTLLFGPPYKEVIAYSDKQKKIYSCPVGKFNSPYAITLLTFDEVSFVDLVLSEKESLSYQGLSAKHYGFSKSFAALQRNRFEHKVSTKRAAMSADLIAASLLNTDPRVVHFVDSLYSLPPTEGLPLNFEFRNFTNSNHFYLSTHHIAAAKLPEATFAPPRNYLKVNTLTGLNYDENSRAGIDFMTEH